MHQIARRVAYRLSPLRKLIEKPQKPNAGAFWDDALRGKFSTYLGGPLSLELRYAVVATLIDYFGPQNATVLDAGCAAGGLANALHSFSRYLGFDVSSVAVEKARTEIAKPNAEFCVASVQDHKLQRQWDAIVFNEVLYYMSVAEASEQIRRYAKALSPNGIICISMKDDAKSRAIWSAAEQILTYKEGITWQAKLSGADYKMRVNHERPAYHIAIFSASLAE